MKLQSKYQRGDNDSIMESNHLLVLRHYGQMAYMELLYLKKRMFRL